MLLNEYLPKLTDLHMHHIGDDAGMQALCEGLGRGAAPSLRVVDMRHNMFGAAGAEALAAALHRGAMPMLKLPTAPKRQPHRQPCTHCTIGRHPVYYPSWSSLQAFVCAGASPVTRATRDLFAGLPGVNGRARKLACPQMTVIRGRRERSELDLVRGEICARSALKF